MESVLRLPEYGVGIRLSWQVAERTPEMVLVFLSHSATGLNSVRIQDKQVRGRPKGMTGAENLMLSTFCGLKVHGCVKGSSDCHLRAVSGEEDLVVSFILVIYILFLFCHDDSFPL